VFDGSASLLFASLLNRQTLSDADINMLKKIVSDLD